MPIYEYRCESCGHTLDALQKISDERLTDCPECEKPQLKRLVSAPSFRLKGSGWYETDFKSDKEKRRNLVDSNSESSDSSSKESGKESSKESGKEANKEKGKSDSSSSTDSKPAKSAQASKPDKSKPAGGNGKGTEAA
jgi:putative FmdB family regulatory protein